MLIYILIAKKEVIMVDGSGWDDRFNDDEGINFFNIKLN